MYCEHRAMAYSGFQAAAAARGWLLLFRRSVRATSLRSVKKMKKPRENRVFHNAHREDIADPKGGKSCNNSWSIPIATTVAKPNDAIRYRRKGHYTYRKQYPLPPWPTAWASTAVDFADSVFAPQLVSAIKALLGRMNYEG